MTCFWIKNHLAHLKELDAQIKRIDQESNLQHLFERLQQHRLLTQDRLAKDIERTSDLNQIEASIQEALQKLSANEQPGNDATAEKKLN